MNKPLAFLRLKEPTYLLWSNISNPPRDLVSWRNEDRWRWISIMMHVIKFNLLSKENKITPELRMLVHFYSKACCSLLPGAYCSLETAIVSCVPQHRSYVTSRPSNTDRSRKRLTREHWASKCRKMNEAMFSKPPPPPKSVLIWYRRPLPLKVQFRQFRYIQILT